MSNKRTHSAMSVSGANSASSALSANSASSALSASSASSALSDSSDSSYSSAIPKMLININHMYENVFFALSAAILLGSLQVNDPNSPGGKRNTHMFCQEVINARGEKGIFESWGEKIAAQVAKWFE